MTRIKLTVEKARVKQIAIQLKSEVLTLRKAICHQHLGVAKRTPVCPDQATERSVASGKWPKLQCVLSKGIKHFLHATRM